MFMNNLPSVVNSLVDFHKNHILKKFLIPRKIGIWGFIIFLFLLTLVSFLSFQTRMIQWNYWDLNQENYYFDKKPMLSGNDSSNYLKEAKQFKKNIPLSESYYKHNFPDNLGNDKDILNKKSIFEISNIRYLIIWISDLFYDGEIFYGANLLVPICAVLTAISISFFFLVLGYSYEGLIAGIGSSLSQSIFVRTSIGRVDTDLLNVSFVYLILSFISISLLSKNRIISFLSISFAGVSSFLFCWWYLHPGFLIIFSIILIFGNFIFKKSILDNLISTLIYIAFSGINFFSKSINSLLSFFEVYIIRIFNYGSSNKISFSSEVYNVTNNLNYPDSLNTITELKLLHYYKVFEYITSSFTPWLSILGILGIIIFIISNPRKAFIISPIFIFTILSFTSGVRFLIFAVPIFWFGIAYIFTSFLMYFICKFSKTDYTKLLFNCFSIPLILFFIFFSWYISPAACKNFKNSFCIPRYIPNTITSPEISKGIMILDNYDINNNGVILTWWDYGYWINLISDLTTVVDASGNHRSGKGYFIAKSLMSKEQKTSFNLLKYVLSNSNSEILNDSSSLKFLKEKINSSKLPDNPSYFFLTNDMMEWWISISYVGNWNIINNKKGKIERFESIDCDFENTKTLKCGNFLIDLQKGKLNNGLQLEYIAITQNGNLKKEIKFEDANKNSPSLIISVEGKTTKFITLEKNMYDYTFTQLFLLNKIDKRFFKLIDDNWPHSRTFKLINN